jgi:hypothetical protein
MSEIRLSAYLAESLPTNNTRYVEAATNSIQFLRTQLFESNLNVMYGSIAVNTGEESCDIGTATNAGDTGLVLEGLSVISAVQGDSNSEWKDL